VRQPCKSRARVVICNSRYIQRPCLSSFEAKPLAAPIFELASRAPFLDAKRMRIAPGIVQVVLALAASLLIAAKPQDPPMKAVVLRAYGGPEVLKVEELPRPETEG
jgi:hypothetical protein